MALATPSPAPTGYSGFWQQMTPTPGQYSPRFSRSSHEYQAAIALGKNGFRKYRVQMRALNNGNPGGTATDSYRRVQSTQAFGDGQSLGGLRTMQTVNNNTTTTVAMQTAINQRVYDRIVQTITYPRDLSGNGGGGKVGR